MLFAQEREGGSLSMRNNHLTADPHGQPERSLCPDGGRFTARGTDRKTETQAARMDGL